MKVEFAVSAGLDFREVEVIEFDDNTSDEEIRIHYESWLFSNIDGGWEKVREAQDD